MSWKGTDKDEILLGLKNGTVTLFALPTHNFSSHAFRCGEKPVCGLVALENGTTVTCMENGLVQLWNDGEVSAKKMVGGHLETCIGNTSNKNIATGGKENDLKV